MKDKNTGLQFVGLAGITEPCTDAVLRYLQYGDVISRVMIFTSEQEHALILHMENGNVVVVKSGFSSGYGGRGPHDFAYVLALLHAYNNDIEEYSVNESIIESIDGSRLTYSELKKIEESRPFRPARWYDYIYAFKNEFETKEKLWNRFPNVIPYSIINPRLFDLAITFWEAPDDKILSGYRKLEDIVRSRCGIEEHGTKLFSKAFMGNTSILYWPDINPAEQTGRANLFIGTFGAFRNRRAHKELKENPQSQLSEFLVLNQLYQLESESLKRPNEEE
jgi:hypothetical protein